MKRPRYLCLAILAGLLALAAQDASAQQRTASRSGWLGFSYEAVTLRTGGERRPAIVILEVVDRSPARRAGLLKGDTILAINDIRVSEPFMGSLGYSLAPGDRVNVRVRRAGSERDIAVTAAERPAGYGLEPTPYGFRFEVDPDEVRTRMRVYLDSARIALDSLRLPSLRVERLPGGEIYMHTDTGRVRLLPGDSAWRSGLWMLPSDSLRLRLRSDSFMTRALPGLRGEWLRTDSMFRLFADSLRLDVRGLLGGRIYGLERDSLFLVQPGDRAFGIATFGWRALAGAELSELNAELGEYFGTDSGILVMRVPDGTPAARAGLEAGDVIVRANDRPVTTLAGLRSAIGVTRTPNTRAPIRLEVLRRNSRRTIELRE